VDEQLTVSYPSSYLTLPDVIDFNKTVMDEIPLLY